MSLSKRSGRFFVVLVAAVLMIVLSGCTIGTTEMTTDGFAMCPVGVDLGPGHVSQTSGDDALYWVPAPGTASLKFAVSSSDSLYPVTATAFLPFVGSETPFGVVWDGRQSTGPKTIPWSGPVVLWLHSPQSHNHVNWWVMALDAKGKEVGFSGCRDR